MIEVRAVYLRQIHLLNWEKECATRHFPECSSGCFNLYACPPAINALASCYSTLKSSHIHFLFPWILSVWLSVAVSGYYPEPHSDYVHVYIGFWQRSSKKTTSDEVVDLVALGACQSRWTALITAPLIWERPSKRCQWGSSYSIEALEPLLWNRIQSVILNFIHHVACFSSSSLSSSCATKAL